MLIIIMTMMIKLFNLTKHPIISFVVVVTDVMIISIVVTIKISSLFFFEFLFAFLWTPLKPNFCQLSTAIIIS